MKAIQVKEFGGPEALELVDLPDPRPGPGQAVVRLRAIGVNPVDTYIRSGIYARSPALPYTPGSDGAGEVEEIGEGVSEIARGDRVFISGSLTGSYAELAVCAASDAHPLPAGATFRQGAALGTPYATAYRALFQRGKAMAGETVLIHGATGGVGLAALQFARAAGLTVFGTGGSANGRDIAAANGAHRVFNHRETEYLAQIQQATKERGVDLIIEMLANVNLGKDLTLLAPLGRVVVVGSRGKVEIDARDTMGRDADIRGIMLGNATPRERAGIYAAIIAGLENGALRPVIGSEVPLAEAPRAHKLVMESGATGKIVLVP